MSRVAIVTGAASGIGRATAALLAAQGVRVAGFDITVDELSTVSRDGGPDAAGAITLAQVDITRNSDVTAAVEMVRGSLGPVDVLVNAAGVAAGGTLDSEGYVQEWQRALDVNLTGMMQVTRACLPDLLAGGAGRVVNVASTEGLTAARRTGPYTVSKHGVVGFTRSLAVDFGRSGLTANAVCPGATLTGMTERIPQQKRDEFARRHVPVGRYAAPEEIAYLIVALCQPAASYVNGAVIPVDGGLTAGSG